MPDLQQPILKTDNGRTGLEGVSNSSDLGQQQSGWDSFLNGLRTYFGFSSGGPAAGNSQGATNIGTNVPGAGSSEPLTHDEVNKVMEQITGIAPDGYSNSAKTAGDIDLSSILGSSALSGSQGLNLLYELYQSTGDVGYLEQIGTALLSRENVKSAQDWEKMMSDTSFSRLANDIKASGYNPWLALQSGIGQTSSSGSGVASTGSSSVTSSRRSAETSAKNTEAQVQSSNMRAGITTALALILALLRFVV